MTQMNSKIQIGMVALSYGWVVRNGKNVVRLKVQLEQDGENWGLPVIDKIDHEGLLVSAKNLMKSLIGDDNVYAEQLMSYGDDNNRREDNTVSIFYIGAVPVNKLYANDKEGTDWFAIDIERDANEKIVGVTLTNNSAKVVNELVDDHMQILMDALNRLQGKILYTDMALHIMGDTFTLSDAQVVYEEIMGRQFGAFRRFISDKVEQTNEYDIYSSRRPSRLFKMKK